MNYKNEVYASTARRARANSKNQEELVGFYPTKQQLDQAWSDWQKARKAYKAKNKNRFKG